METKKSWVQPLAVVQQFAANEYVAACGDSGTVYNFECNAGNKDSTYNVYYEDGSEVSGTEGLSYYHPCNKKHEANEGTGFYSGYMIETTYEYGLFGRVREHEVGEKIPVIIWTDNNTNVHCTTNLDMSNWETAKS